MCREHGLLINMTNVRVCHPVSQFSDQRIRAFYGSSSKCKEKFKCATVRVTNVQFYQNFSNKHWTSSTFGIQIKFLKLFSRTWIGVKYYLKPILFCQFELLLSAQKTFDSSINFRGLLSKIIVIDSSLSFCFMIEKWKFCSNGVYEKYLE